MGVESGQDQGVLPLKKTHETFTAISTGAVPVALGMIFALIDRLGYELADWLLWIGLLVAVVLLAICFATTMQVVWRWWAGRKSKDAAAAAISAYGKAAAPANGKYVVGGRAEDEPGVSIGPIPTVEALNVFADSEEYVPIEDAGRWLYTNAGEGLQKVLRDSVPSPFNTIAEHGAAMFRTRWTENACKLHGRWEPGLPMEEIDAKDGHFSTFEKMFGTAKKQIIDLSVKRRDLQPVLDYYDQAATQRLGEPIKVKRDVRLAEALMYAVIGEWGRDPLADGGGHLAALSAALETFRQKAHDGLITVWGKADNYGVWQVIAPAYWVAHYVDFPDVLRSVTPSKPYNQLSYDPLFIDLMVSRAEFEAEWRGD